MSTPKSWRKTDPMPPSHPAHLFSRSLGRSTSTTSSRLAGRPERSHSSTSRTDGTRMPNANDTVIQNQIEVPVHPQDCVCEACRLGGDFKTCRELVSEVHNFIGATDFVAQVGALVRKHEEEVAALWGQVWNQLAPHLVLSPYRKIESLKEKHSVVEQAIRDEAEREKSVLRSEVMNSF